MNLSIELTKGVRGRTNVPYVYLWRDPKDATPRYVGEGHAQRVWDHFDERSNSRTALMLKKRLHEGYVCIPSIVWCRSNDEMDELEIFLISEIGRESLGTGTLFNMADGGKSGSRGWVATTEFRQKISARTKGQPKGVNWKASTQSMRARILRAESNRARGNPGMKAMQTPEARAKSAAAQLGVKRGIRPQVSCIKCRKVMGCYWFHTAEKCA